MPGEKPGKSWKLVQAIGIIVAVLGLVYLVYSAYLLTVGPTVTVASRFIPVTSNPSSLNYGYNPGAGCSFSPLGIYSDIFSGILMILLGIVTFLYGRTKMQS